MSASQILGSQIESDGNCAYSYIVVKLNLLEIAKSQSNSPFKSIVRYGMTKRKSGTRWREISGKEEFRGDDYAMIVVRRHCSDQLPSYAKNPGHAAIIDEYLIDSMREETSVSPNVFPGFHNESQYGWVNGMCREKAENEQLRNEMRKDLIRALEEGETVKKVCFLASRNITCLENKFPNKIS
jgi:hypothetical protein